VAVGVFSISDKICYPHRRDVTERRKRASFRARIPDPSRKTAIVLALIRP